jgi:hypothetical protein
MSEELREINIRTSEFSCTKTLQYQLEIILQAYKGWLRRRLAFTTPRKSPAWSKVSVLEQASLGS